MATPPTFVGENETVWNTATTPKTVTFTPGSGNILAALAASQDAATTLALTSGPTWTLRQSSVLGSTCASYAWTGAGAGTSVTPSLALSGSTNNFGMNILEFSGSDGVGASAKSASAQTTAHVTQAITTAQDNSALLVIITDWNAVLATTRTWDTVNGFAPSAANGKEVSFYQTAGSDYTVLAAYYPDAGVAGSKTVGVTVPTAMKAILIVVEVKGNAAGAAGPVCLPQPFPPFGPMFLDPFATPFQMLGDQTTPAAAGAAGTIDLAGSAAAQSATTAVGSLTLAGSSSAGAAATAVGSLTLAGTASAAAPAFAAGAITLSGTATAAGIVVDQPTAGPQLAAMFLQPSAASFQMAGDTTPAAGAAGTATGSLTFGGNAAGQAPATATGSLSLSGSATPAAPTTAAGSMTLAGAASTGTPATGTGSLTFSGTANAAAAASAAGAITFTGIASAGTTAAASGSITFTGSAVGPGAAATGAIILAGTASAAAPATASGSLTLGGSGMPGAAGAAAGSITLGGSAVGPGASAAGSLTLSATAAGKAAASPTGALALTGTALVGTRATATGSITLTATAGATARASGITGMITLGGISATSGAPVTVTGSDRPTTTVTSSDRPTATITSG